MHRSITPLTFFIFLNSTLCAMDSSDLGEQLRNNIKIGYTSRALELIAAGAPVNLEPLKPTYAGSAFGDDDVKLSALQLAAKVGDLEVLRALLKAGASLATQKVPQGARVIATQWSAAKEASREKSPLMYAAERGPFECVKELLAAKTDVHEKDRSGNTALIWAVKRDRFDCVRELIAAKSDVNCCGGQSGDMALLIAIKEKNEACVHELIAAKAEVNNKQFADVAGDTPLVCAAKYGTPGCMRMLIDAKADVNKMADYGATPLIKAAGNGDRDCVKMLLAAGALVNPKDSHIGSALDISALKGHMQICELLVEALLKVPNKKQSAPIITLFGLIKKKFSFTYNTRELYRNRDVFFKNLFCMAIEAQNRDNFAESLAGMQVKKLRSDPLPQYKFVGDFLFEIYKSNGKASKSQSKCTLQ
jgi:ankyrin repeat protein